MLALQLPTHPLLSPLNVKPICCGRRASEGPDLVTQISLLLEDSGAGPDRNGKAACISEELAAEKT